MIQKIHCPCAINAQIIILICGAINVHRVSISSFFHLCRLVSSCLHCRKNSIEYLKNLILSLFHILEILPLVEFSPEEEIAEAEVERLLMAPPKSADASFDPFVDRMVNEDISDMLPLTLDREALRALDPTTILLAKWPKPLKTRYYRNLMPEWQISMCHVCFQVV